MGELDMDDEFLSMLDTIKGAKYSYLIQHIKHLEYKVWLNLLLEEYETDAVNALQVQDERLLQQLRMPLISISGVDLLACKNALQVLREDLPDR